MFGEEHKLLSKFDSVALIDREEMKVLFHPSQLCFPLLLATDGYGMVDT